ncbi:transcription factor LUX-like [Dorcoceras hygrometricum]|uniref:Transcription factor LUX-like n=1 Tax=Dorcoceras hygrometricum TaxID=472368 RepID=A0A2Z7CME1_9LAMI|nr:transcription factor LUX-like [Dorcoceras hygrometricum]
MLTSSLLITVSSNRNADVIIAYSRFLFTSTSDSFTLAQQLIHLLFVQLWSSSSPTSYVDVVDKAMDIEEGLRNRGSRIQPQAAQGETGSASGYEQLSAQRAGGERERNELVRSEWDSCATSFGGSQIWYTVESRYGIVFRSELVPATIPIGARFVSLSSPCQNASITTSFGDFGELEEEREEASVCYLFAFQSIGSSIQVSDLSTRDPCCGNCSTEAKDSVIEDERRYRAPHLPVGLVVSR